MAHNFSSNEQPIFQVVYCAPNPICNHLCLYSMMAVEWNCYENETLCTPGRAWPGEVRLVRVGEHKAVSHILCMHIAL